MSVSNKKGRQMSVSNAFVCLLLIFVGFLLVSIVPIVVTFLQKYVASGSMVILFIKLITVYSVPLGAVIAGFFGQRASSKTQVPLSVFVVTLVLCVVWNIFVAWCSISFAVSDDTVRDLGNYLDKVVPFTFFFISGLSSYFYARST